MKLQLCRAILLICTALLTACGSVLHPDHPGKADRDTSAFITSQLHDLSTLPCPAGVKQQTWDELRAALRMTLERRLVELKSGARGTAVAPTSDLAQTTLTWNVAGPALEWRYYNPGDYNQDGEVNISDLTPLAVHLNQSPPPDTTDDIRCVIDGDNNGLINISDLTPLGANLGHRITGYNIFTSFNVADYPAGNAASSISPFVFLPLTNAVGPANAIRLGYSYTLNLNGGVYYWVRPMDVGDETEGPASNYILGGGSRPNASFTATQVAGEVPLVVGLNAGTSSGLPALTYYWDLNGDGVYEWNGTDATVSKNFTTTGAFTVSLRVVDALNYSDTATMTFNVNMARTWKRFGLPPLGSWDVKCLSLGYANGLPWLAVCGDDLTAGFNRMAYYIGGTPVGSAWSEQQLGFGGVTSFAAATDNAMVGGVPAMLWSKTDLGAVYYTRADEPFGSGWQQGTVLIFDAFERQWFSLAIINGKPGVGWYSESNGLGYFESDDALGSSWSTAYYVFGFGASDRGQGASLAEVNGAPALAYFDATGGGIYYVDSTLVGGNPVWDVPVQIAPTTSMAMFDGLYVLPNGVPAVVFHDRENNAVVQVTANGASGDSWGLPGALGDTGGEVRLVPRAVVCDGRAHIFYYDFAADKLLHSETLDAGFQDYSALETVATGIDGSVGLNVADLGGYPGVAYLSATGEPRVAIKY